MKIKILLLLSLILIASSSIIDKVEEITVQTNCTQIESCEECNDTQTECYQCKEGYFLDNLNVLNCKLCSANISQCIKCDNNAGDVTCEKCEPGYVLDTNKKNCLQCVAGCQVCTNQTSCETCFKKYYLEGGQCSLCSASAAIPRCEECSDSKTCTKCVEPTEFPNPGACDKCTKINCGQCVSKISCSSCINDLYYLKRDGEKTTCQLCRVAMVGCSNCTLSGSICDACLSGYYQLTDKTGCKGCGSVTEKCIKCSSSRKCNECEEGYKLEDNKCESDSSSTIIIVAAVVGGVVLIGAGVAIFKCVKKKKGTSLLEGEDDD